ncbi:MAG: transcriptional regulator [Deltaproteobacteria bacterium]|jgi:YHS domain-containing protein|nr:transcriptional regulator [Deltaproteobacteria bacterium]
MLKFAIIALAIFVAYKLFSNDFLRKRKDEEKKQGQEQEKKVASGELVKDPICGVYVALDDSVSVKDGDHVYRFCSYECRDKFLMQLEQGGREIPSNDDK